MDPFVHLPNEVLQEVFKHVPSLPALFKLAAVNRKFRRGALKIIQKPMPLDIHFQQQTINGFNIPHNSWKETVEVLAKRSRFGDIRICGACPAAVLEMILNTLTGSDHLNGVKVFQSVEGTNSSVLEQFLAKCDQLHQLDLQFPMSRFPNPNARPLDLTTVLSNKALEFLLLYLDVYPVEHLSAAFQSLAPNTLQRCLIKILHPLDLVRFLGEVPDSLRSALTSLSFLICASNDAQLGLLEVVAHMPLLQECSIVFSGQGHEVTVPFHQFADAVILLFNKHETRANLLVIKHIDFRLSGTTGCAVFHLIRTLQQHHPQLQVQFDVDNCTDLQFTLGNISLDWTALGGLDDCAAVCLECRSFYPTVVFSLLLRQAEETLTNGHLHDRQLDRCKVHRVVQDYNWVANDTGSHCKAVSATLNEAQDQATITIEMEGHEEFNITVDCDRCFINSCVTCGVQD